MIWRSGLVASNLKGRMKMWDVSDIIGAGSYSGGPHRWEGRAARPRRVNRADLVVAPALAAGAAASAGSAPPAAATAATSSAVSAEVANWRARHVSRSNKKG